MKKLLIPFAILAVSMMSACKKTDHAAPSLVGKWNVVSVLDTLVISGQVSFADKYSGTSSDFIEFTSDNKTHAHVNGTDDTVTYQLQGNNTVVIDQDSYTIQTLTGSSCTLDFKDMTDASNYSREIINLSR